MRTLTRLSRKAQEFCELSNYDVVRVKELINQSGFSVKRCETKEEMDDNRVDYCFPYVIFNPHNFSIK